MKATLTFYKIKYSRFYFKRALLTVLIAFIAHLSYASTTYYVSNSAGNDSNNGTTSSTPWKTLTKVSNHTFSPGDSVLLKCGELWSTVQLSLKGDGTTANPIVLTSYGSGNKPHIKGMQMDSACIRIQQVAGWKITNLELSDAREGIRAEYDQIYNKNFLWIENCFIHDMISQYNSNAYLFNHLSCGVTINGFTPAGNGRLISLTAFTMKNCVFDNCNIGFNGVGTIFSHCNSSTGFTTGDLTQMTNVNVTGCTATNCKQIALQFCSCATGTVSNILTKHTGGGLYHPGVASIVVTYCQNMIFDNCTMLYTYAGAPQPYDGCGFDFEGGTAPDGTYEHDITLKNSVIDYTDGCGIFVFSNNGVGHNLTINNVVISHFGIGISNHNEGIWCAGGSTGIIENTTFNRSITANPTIGGNSSGFTFGTNYTNEIVNDAAPLVLNTGFESPTVPTYQYGSFPNDWEFDDHSGIQANGSAFSAAGAPDGQQTAFIQSTGVFNQWITLPSAGNFVINFKAAKRTCCGGTESFNVNLDNTSLSSFTPSSGTFSTYSTKPFAATAGLHEISFQGTAFGDNTDFIDVVNLVPYNPIANGGFEQPLQTSGHYQYGPVTNGWTFDSASGVQSNGSAFSASTAPEGTQTAFIQGLGTIKQTIKAISAGTFYLQFQAAKRTCCGGTESFNVYVDTTMVGSYTPSSGSFVLSNTTAFALDTNSHVLKFAGTASGDNTDFIDMVKLMPTGNNMGFESPAVSTYQYGSFTNGWTFGTQAGVQKNGSAFSGTQNAPEGTQTSFIQGSGLNALISQYFNFPSPGNYIINFSAAQRANSGGAQTISVHVDNTRLQGYTPGTTFTNYTSPVFYVTAGIHGIAFLGETAGSNTDFIDNVSVSSIIVPPPTPGNFGFENPVQAANQYQAGPFTSTWAFSSSSGVQRNGSSYSGTQNAPEGVQTAYVTANGSISQTVNFTASGSFSVQFKSAQRLNAGGPQTFNVFVDSTNVGTFKPLSGSFKTLQSNVFSVAQGNHLIKFQGITTGDSTAFIDSVLIIPQNGPLNNYAAKIKLTDSVSTGAIASDSTISSQVSDKFVIYPNPTHANAQIRFTLTKNTSLTVEIHSVYGKLMYQSSLGNLTKGTHNTNIDTANFPNGIYIVDIKGYNYYKSAKLQVSK